MKVLDISVILFGTGDIFLVIGPCICTFPIVATYSQNYATKAYFVKPLLHITISLIVWMFVPVMTRQQIFQIRRVLIIIPPGLRVDLGDEGLPLAGDVLLQVAILAVFHYHVKLS